MRGLEVQAKHRDGIRLPTGHNAYICWVAVCPICGENNYVCISNWSNDRVPNKDNLLLDGNIHDSILCPHLTRAHRESGRDRAAKIIFHFFPQHVPAARCSYALDVEI